MLKRGLTLILMLMLATCAFAASGYFQGDSAMVLGVADADGNLMISQNTLLDIFRIHQGCLLYISDEAWLYDQLVPWNGLIINALDLATNEYAVDLRDNSTGIFLVDKEGDAFIKGNLNLDSAASDLYWNDGQYIAGQLSSARRQLWLGGTGGAKNNYLRMDFDLYDNRVVLLDGITMNHDFQIDDNVYHLVFGTGSDVRMRWETDGGFDFWQLGTYLGSAANSGYVVLLENTDMDDTDGFPTAAASAPTLVLLPDNPTSWANRLELYRASTGSYINDPGGTLWLGDSGGTYTLAQLAVDTTGAPVDASYLTLGTNATLTAERVLTAGNSIYITDAGAGSTATVGVSYGGIGADQLAATAVTGGAYTLTDLTVDGDGRVTAASSHSITGWDTDSSNDLTTTSAWTGGDLAGTGLAATVNDNSHDHSTTITGKAANVSDADFGDVTVSSGAWSVDSGAITLQEILASVAAGDMIYRNATVWGILTAGADNDVFTMNGSYPNWEASAAGGDITSVGDVADGAAFDGTQGTTLTFNNAGGDATIGYNGTQFDLDKQLVVAGNIYSDGVLPVVDLGRNLGSLTRRWSILYGQAVYFYDSFGDLGGSIGTPGSGYLYINASLIGLDGTTYPKTDSDYNFGASNKRWAVSYFDQIDIGADANSYIQFSEIAAPAANPAANKGWIYWKDNSGTSTCYMEDDAGTVTQLGVSAAHLLLSATHSDTIAKAVAVNSLVYGGAGGGGKWDALPSGNSGILVTGATGIPSIATDIPTAVTIGGKYVYRADGTDVPVADGGTNISSFVAGDLLYATDTTTLARLPKGTAGQVLTMNGGGALPAWAASGSAPAGTMIRLNADNTSANTAVDAVLATYALAANTYSYIQVRAEGYVVGAANSAFNWSFYIRNDGAQVDNAVSSCGAATGTGDQFKTPFSVTAEFTDTGGAAAIDCYADEIVDTGTSYITAFYIWGVI